MLKINKKLSALCLGFTMFFSACSQKQLGSDVPIGSGDLDSNRKSGSYYLKLNENNNSHLPKGKTYEVLGEKYTPYTASNGFTEVGIASWYGPGFHGKLTANGEKYNQRGITAAHKLLPFNTMIRVINLENGKSVVVRINDRGPFHDDRIIDLSEGAAKEIDMLTSGTAKVFLHVEGESADIGKVSGGTSNSLGTVNLGTGKLGAVGMATTSGLPSNNYNRFGETTSSVVGSAYGITFDNAKLAGASKANSPAKPTTGNTSNQGINPYNANTQNQAISSQNSSGVYTAAYGQSSSASINTTNTITPKEIASKANTSVTPTQSTIPTNMNAPIALIPSVNIELTEDLNNVSSISGAYFLQLTLFDDKSMANDLASTLRLQGFPTEVFSDKDFYLVQSGPYKTDYSALRARNKLQERFPKSYFVIR